MRAYSPGLMPNALGDVRPLRVSKRATPRYSCVAGIAIVAVNNSART